MTSRCLDGAKELCIKYLLIIPFIFLILHPNRIKASELPPTPYEQTAAHKPTYEEEQQALSDYLTGRAVAAVGQKGNQCVLFVRQFGNVGPDKVHGLAKNTKTNSQVPAVGAVIKLNLSVWGHVGIVLSYDDKVVKYVDSNGDKYLSQRIAIRTIPLDDPRIMGYLVN